MGFLLQAKDGGKGDPALSGIIARGMTLYTRLDEQHAFRNQPALHGEVAAFYALASAAEHRRHRNSQPEAAAKALDKALPRYTGGNLSQLQLAQGLLAREVGDHDAAAIAFLQARQGATNPQLQRPLLAAAFDEAAHTSPLVKSEIKAVWNDQVSRAAKQHWPDPEFKTFVESYIGVM